MTWTSKPTGRRNQLPANWDTIRNTTRQRAGGQCEWTMPDGQRCTAPGTDCDHYGDRNDHTRTRWLCPPHHQQHTAQQSIDARRRLAARARRPVQKHPGLL